MGGLSAAAAKEYHQAHISNPFEPTAAGDLALLEAKQHRYADAVRLWKAVFDHDPTQPGAGMNLAIVECSLGDRDAAMATLARILEFSPDNGQARKLAAELRSDSRRCVAR
jgi:tetratricopeptide (TPR) repeat protein